MRAKLWPGEMEDLFERHPVAPFISLHHESVLFESVSMPKADFFKAMHTDPTGFLQNSVVEVNSGENGAEGWVCAIATGYSVRLLRPQDPLAMYASAL